MSTCGNIKSPGRQVAKSHSAGLTAGAAFCHNRGMDTTISARSAFVLLAFAAAFAGGCVQVEPEYERRTSVWVSDSTTSGYTENDARRAFVPPAGVLPPGEPFAASLSFGGSGLSAAARADPHVRPLSVAIVHGGAAARRVPADGADVFVFSEGSAGAFAVEGLVAREKPWLLGNAEDDDEEVASGADLLYLRGCMDRRKWVSRSVWPDPHMSLFLDRLRALCAQLCGE